MNRRRFIKPASRPDPKMLPQSKKRFAGQPECWECAHGIFFTTPVYAMLKCALLPDFLPFGLHWAACIRFSPRKDIYKAGSNG